MIYQGKILGEITDIWGRNNEAWEIETIGTCLLPIDQQTGGSQRM